MTIATTTYDDAFWQVVPKEPNIEMLNSMDKSSAFQTYKNMLAAAPTLPSVQALPEIVPWMERGPFDDDKHMAECVDAELSEYRALVAQMKGMK